MPIEPTVSSSHHRALAGECIAVDFQPAARGWYFTKDEIDNHSPSRKDDIDRVCESRIRKSFCSFLKELGIKLRVSPVATATAMMFCHRFYMRQSLAKNDWRTIATACMFLACKVEENLHPLRDVVVVAYEIIYKGNPSASKKIRQRDDYYKQQELILNAEHLLLVTIAFDMNIQHPFKPLVDALKKIKISNNDVAKAAWNLLNEWLQTTLCLQYKPHYIAAASLSVAAKLLDFRLPVEEGMAWWMHFDVSPKQLQEVTEQMLRYFKHDRKQKVTQSRANEIKSTQKGENRTSQGTQSRAQSGLTTGSHMKTEDAQAESKMRKPPPLKNSLNYTTKIHQGTSKEASACCSRISSLEDDDSSHTSPIKARRDDCEIDVDHIRGIFEKARHIKYANNKFVTAAAGNEGKNDRLIERKLNEAVEHAAKKRRMV